MFKKLLIANRGEIACRVIRTAHKMGISTVAVYSEADKLSLHTQMADETIYIGDSSARQSYLVIEKIINAAQESGADAVHPGYGFLSENPRFAKALDAVGIIFIGPPSTAIELMGDKITSKKIAHEAGVNIVPGFMGLINDVDEAIRISKDIGYPVMLKASAGGGGKGMRIAWCDQDVQEGFHSSKNEAASSFGDDRIFIEKFITHPRHIEMQVLSDSCGNCIFLGERECSIQRRNQKVVEEAPSSFLDESTRNAMGRQAVALAKAVNYVSAGTVEFIVDKDKNFYFLEMNTRLQVEHPVTELITEIDLVEQMIRVANGECLAITQDDVSVTGWAVENRLYAEDPFRDFLPSTGRLTRYRPPAEKVAGPLSMDGVSSSTTDVSSCAVRVDTGVFEGGEISIHYDPMIAKLCTWGYDRMSAIEAMRVALDCFEVEGIGHNLPFVSAVMDHPRFISGDITTGFISEEYPEGFTQVELSADCLKRIVVCAAAMNQFAEIRRTHVSGLVHNNVRKVGKAWLATVLDDQFKVEVTTDPEGSVIVLDDCAPYRVTSDWTPGNTLANICVNGTSMVLKVQMVTGGFRIRFRGADLNIQFHSPRHAELARLMPKKVPPDTSKLLLCPMPGLVVRIDVVRGQKVQEGQSLCTIEAMKMENILRAERIGVVKTINVVANDSLAVDDVIMEFE